ncbi:MAG: ABC transporter permease [Candidatus Nanopelagicaceae bacterium]|jgi:putative spermidine/putrescine transport system permease protein
MIISKKVKYFLASIMGIGLSFIYVPLLIVVINSFNASKTFSWPPKEFTFNWWNKAIENTGVREALGWSLIAGFCATVIALILGTCLAFAVAKYSFFGKETISLLVVLPISLPGIVTGLALNNAFNQTLGIGTSLLTIVIGHATFCIVIVYNNAIARLKRMGGSLQEASMDLGANGFTTFRLVTLPNISSALFAGGLLAFGLSFDEIVVTTFTAGPGIQTLPVWIFNNLFRPNQAPIVNVVAATLVVLSIVPIYLSQRLSSDSASGGRL